MEKDLGNQDIPYISPNIDINCYKQHIGLQQLTVPYDNTNIMELRGPHLPEGSILLKKTSIQNLSQCNRLAFFCCPLLLYKKKPLKEIPIEEVHINFGNQDSRDFHFYEQICQIPTLKILTLNFGKELQVILPSLSLSNLNDLQQLTLHYSNHYSLNASHIENITTELQQLQNLKRFHFSLSSDSSHSFTGTQFKTFVQTISKLPKLLVLTLFIKGVTHINEEDYHNAYTYLSQIKTFYELSLNVTEYNLIPLISLRDKMMLDQLSTLSLEFNTENNVDEFTKGTQKFHKLNTFSIKCNDLRQIAQFVKWVYSSANSVYDLELHYTYVHKEDAIEVATEISDYLALLPCIGKFIMEYKGDNSNEILPQVYKDIKVSKFQWENLKELYLSSSIIDLFPDWYLQFKTLKYFYLKTTILCHSKQIFESLANGLKDIKLLIEFAIEINPHCQGERIDDSTLIKFFSSFENKQVLKHLKIINLCFMDASDRAMMKFIDISTKKNLKYVSVHLKQLSNVTVLPFKQMLVNLVDPGNLEFYKMVIEGCVLLTSQNINDLNKYLKKKVKKIPYFKFDIFGAPNVSDEVRQKFYETQRKLKLFQRYIYTDELSDKDPFFPRRDPPEFQ